MYPKNVQAHTIHVVGWRRIERRQLSCVFLFLLYFFSSGLALSMGWGGGGGGINVMLRVRGTRSCLTHSWCYAQHFFLATSHTLLMLRSALLQATSTRLLMLRSALLQGTSHTLLMLRSALFPSNFSHALDVTLSTFS